MIRRSLFLVLFAAGGCNALAGILQGTLETAPDCAIRPEGTALPDQIPGDCAVVVCDGRGGSFVVEALTDNDDGNPCTTDFCAGQTPIHTPITGKIICYEGRTGTEGVGICRSGKQVCNNGLAEGFCEGQVVQTAERCDPQFEDEDCDGLSNEEGEGCFCGDGIVQQALGEECDVDPNLPPDPDCPDNCKFPAICGDGIIQSSESCDDGNQIDGDGCPADCLHTIVELSAGTYHTCALFEDGRMKCWGQNDARQLGLGDTKDRGTNLGEMGRWLPTVNVGANKIIAHIAAGASNSCTVHTDGSVKCWGVGSLQDSISINNPSGMVNQLPEIDLAASATSVDIGIWDYSYQEACAILQGGQIKCWGGGALAELQGVHTPLENNMGEELPTVNLGTGLKAIAVATTGRHACALFDNGRIKCWGYNDHGELGLGNVPSYGITPDTIGDALPFVDLGTGALAQSVVAAREGYSCALLVGGSVKCWGYGKRLGLGSKENRGDDDGEMGDALPAVDLGPGAIATAISATDGFTCALLSNGTVKCWGANDWGQLGLGDINPRGMFAGEMGSALPIVDLGSNAFVTAITTGSRHACAVINGQHVKCWGDNQIIGIGRPALTSTGDEPGEMGDALPFVQLW